VPAISDPLQRKNAKSGTSTGLFNLPASQGQYAKGGGAFIEKNRRYLKRRGFTGHEELPRIPLSGSAG